MKRNTLKLSSLIILASAGLMLCLAGCNGEEAQIDECEDVICDSPPADHCDGNAVVTYESGGDCVITAEGPECLYESTRRPCGDEECREIDGVPECVPVEPEETCADIEPCDSPPADYCDGNVLVTHESEGVCEETPDGPECVYETEELDCAADERVCLVEDDGPSCVDLCAEVTCPPREDECDEDVVVVYGGADGECDFETGECAYPADDETRTPCDETEICTLDEDGAPHCVEPVLTCPDSCMVLIDDTYCVDRYEASRPDATDTGQGTSETHAVCAAGVMPWYSPALTGAEAEMACQAAGKRLCTVDEWENVCSNRGTTEYSYGDEYDPLTCNGIDTFCYCDSERCEDADPCPYPECYRLGPDGDAPGCGSNWGVWPTGTVIEGADECATDDGIYDVSGNVWEAVFDPDTDPEDGHVYQFRGGATNCIVSSNLHRCSYVAYGHQVNMKGFRCCADPVLSD